MKRLMFVISIVVLPLLCWGDENEKVTKKLEKRYRFVHYQGSYSGGYIVVDKNWKEGVCDEKGKEIIPPIWDDVTLSTTSSTKSYIKVEKNGFIGVRDWENVEIIAANKYDDILVNQLDKGQICEVEFKGKKGVYDIVKQKEIIPCKYDDTYFFQLREGQVCSVKNKGKEGVYDIVKQKEIIPCKYDDIHSFQLREGGQFCNVEINGKEGAYDIVKQKEIIPCKYDDVYSWELKKRQVCIVKIKEKYGIYDVVKQKEIIPCKYDDISTFQLNKKHAYKVVKDNKYGIIDENDNEIIPLNEYGYMELGFKDEQAIVAFVQTEALIRLAYHDEHHKYHNSEYIKKGKCGVVDLLTRKRIIPCQYSDIELSDEGLYTFNIGGSKPQIIIKGSSTAVGGKWGVIDSNNKIVIPAEYDFPVVFRDGVAQVSKNGVSSLLLHPYNGSSLALANGIVNSDIDSRIPQTNKKSDETFAFIIANENYANFTGADFSIKDGKVFAEYCKKTLGLTEHNVRYFEDATYGNLVSAIKKVEDIASVYEGDATIIFYYSGLGTVDEHNKERYILPTDASKNTLESTGYRVQKLIEQLYRLKTKNTLILLDAPFTGADKKGKALVANRSVRISPKQNTTKGTAIVCFSNSNDENSYASSKYGHGLFTFGILKKLQETEGNCSWKELLEGVLEIVRKESLSEFDKVQTPLIIAPK